MFTPNNKWLAIAKPGCSASDAKSAVTEQDNSAAILRDKLDDTSRQLRSALFNSSDSVDHRQHKVDPVPDAVAVVRSFATDDNVFADSVRVEPDHGFLPTAVGA